MALDYTSPASGIRQLAAGVKGHASRSIFVDTDGEYTLTFENGSSATLTLIAGVVYPFCIISGDALAGTVYLLD
jgi:hypothetical protein